MPFHAVCRRFLGPTQADYSHQLWLSSSSAIGIHFMECLRRRLHPSRTTLRMRSRSANLWFGRLLEGDDYRWWEVSYLYGSDSSDGEPEPFGHCKRFVTYGSRLACDPWPITPEHVDAFFDRWVEL